jgi:Fuc2NAc and GlcNAc transferase
MLPLVILAALLAIAGGCLLTAQVRALALRSQMLDVPNPRSLHRRPVPRGGGLGFAIVIAGSLLLLIAWCSEHRSTGVGLLGSALLVAGVGWWDDRRSLGILPRLAVHLLAATWLVFWVGVAGPAVASGPTGVMLAAVATTYVVWCINLYNFMDGIDGLAGSQAVVAGLFAAGLCLAQGDHLLGLTMLVTGCSVAGFLVWNWPPAKVFMGDCGSGLLGLLFGGLVVAGPVHGSIPAAAAWLLVSVFFMDATLTLLRRLATGERWYLPHCSHAYQLAVKRGATHRQVTLSAGLLFLAAGAVACLQSWILILPWCAALTAIWSLWQVPRRGTCHTVRGLAALNQLLTPAKWR